MVSAPKQLKIALRRRKWSTHELERRIGLGNGVVSRWALGFRRPEHHHRLILEVWLGIPALSWLTDEESSLVNRAVIAAAAEATPDTAA